MSMFSKISNNIKALKFLFTVKRKECVDLVISSKMQQKGRYKLFGNNKLNNSTIGKHSYLAYNAIAYNCSIGNYCSVGPNTVIGYGDHPLDFVSTSPESYIHLLTSDEQKRLNEKAFRKVIIEHDVWIGANTYIKNGVKISTGAVIGANSYVNSDVPPYSIYAGSPAKFVKFRFDEKTIERLLKSEWWKSNNESLDKDLQLEMIKKSSFLK